MIPFREREGVRRKFLFLLFPVSKIHQCPLFYFFKNLFVGKSVTIEIKDTFVIFQMFIRAPLKSEQVVCPMCNSSHIAIIFTFARLNSSSIRIPKASWRISFRMSISLFIVKYVSFTLIIFTLFPTCQEQHFKIFPDLRTRF